MTNTIKRLHVGKDPGARKSWENLLISANIKPEKTVDYTAGVFDGDNLIATASIFQNIIKCVAVSKEYSGGKVFNMLITNMMEEIFDRGYLSSYVYTKEESAHSFIYLGFREIARVPNKLVFLEKAAKGFSAFIDNLKKTRVGGEKVAGIVMNANPFTNGHLYLVETAAKENDVLHVFVLSEDMSDFPRSVRYELVKKGTSHIKNIILHETGDYMVSAKTFPSYFLKEDDDVTYIQASLDGVIFKNQIAKALGITQRYVGEEPFSHSTAIYNKALKNVFENDLKLTVIKRKTANEEAISASRVRKLFKDNEMEKIKALVPETTYEFLNSSEGKLIQKRIQEKEV